MTTSRSALRGSQNSGNGNSQCSNDRAALQQQRDRSVTDLFSEHAQRMPNAVSLTSATETLTYQDLDQETNRMAHYLRACGVGADVPVGICLDRSPLMILAALAILKAGGAYMPLDPLCPPERLAYMLNDACVPLLITREDIARKVSAGNCEVVLLDKDASLIGQHPPTTLDTVSSGEHVAYVIYTSGSTGKPKGVQITHASLLNLVSWHQDEFAVTPKDRASQIANVSFDAAVWEVWPYLSAGASVHFPGEWARFEASALRDWLLRERITISFAPTVLARQLMKLKWPKDGTLRVLLTGADTLPDYPPSDLPFLVVNNYGPTECTVVTTSGPVLPHASADRKPTIGRPIRNVQVYIVDDKLRQVAIGTTGELLVGGAGLARGYLNRPGLNAERFIPNPFSAELGSRLYRTGDLARYLPDGQITFVGRIDEQIKVRGYRIEPAEIEAVLDQCPGVCASAVVARTDKFGENSLVAYILPSAGGQLSHKALREFLRLRLPEYMVPPFFVSVKMLPITSNGKIDGAALPDPTTDNLIRDELAAAPETPTQQRLLAILAELLGVRQIGVNDNFFLLGGHSLLGAQLIARTCDSFGIDLPLRTIFDFPTVSELSAKLEELVRARIEAMSPEEVQNALSQLK